MNLTIHSSFLPHVDPDASIAFYRDVLGFEVRQDVGSDAVRWVTVGPAGGHQPSIVLYPPQATPGVTDGEKQMIAEMMAKGTFGILVLATSDLDGVFHALRERGADIVQEPTDQPWGVRDGSVRDPAGNLIRINQSS